MRQRTSKHITTVGASETLPMSAKAKELAAQGADMMSENVDRLKPDHWLREEDRDVY